MVSSKMQISSLISPQDATGSSQPLLANSRATSPKRKSQPRSRATSLVQKAVTSPRHFDHDHPILPQNAVSMAQFMPSPSSTSPSTAGSVKTLYSALGTPSESRGSIGIHLSPQIIARLPATPMDTLADLATMQHDQRTARHQSYTLRHIDLQEPHRSPSISSGSTALRKPSVVPSEHPMSEAPVMTLQPRAFSSSALSSADLQKISDLAKQLSDNSYLYDSHMQLINLLHQGFLSHISPSDTEQILGSPNDYDLLPDLRQAREAMNSRYPVGETLWLDWLQDEVRVDKTVEDAVVLMELCQKAVQDEVGSSKIWRFYGDLMWSLFSTAFSVSSSYDDNNLENLQITVGQVFARQTWTEDEKLVGQELFTWETMLEVWKHGVRATQWHINNSHLMWDPYIQIILHNLSAAPTSQKIQHVRTLFTDRLGQPHATWTNTCTMFSRFISSYHNNSYEEIMVAMTKQSAKAKQEYDLRQEYETNLQRAEASGDKDGEWKVMLEYLDWESIQSRKKNASGLSFDLVMGLSERANLRFPTDADMWEDHVDLLAENSTVTDVLASVAYRATRHCPWSGNLWAKRLYALEASNNNFLDLEEVKHHATSTGVLEEVGGIEELIKINVAWCGFLRRRAFMAESGEDERDVAEVGILSAIENIEKIGEKKYGKDFKGDPLFRVEKIYFKFLAQTGNLVKARKYWQKLTLLHGDQYDFWDRFYLWEMTLWGHNLRLSSPTRHPWPVPEHATAVLQRAIRRPQLDWPEKMIEFYIHHCSQHETVQKLQEAHVEARRASKQVAKRRAKEAADVATVQGPSQEDFHIAYKDLLPEESSAPGKRKRKDADGRGSSKKARGEEDSAQKQTSGDDLASAIPQLKRDRENTTVIVRRLPKDTTEGRVRRFFRDCGQILDIKLVPENDEDSATAAIEFESKEDVLTAQTKTMKTYDGHSIDIEFGTGTTLWVTNYPPEADEVYIRTLFKEFGDIVDVRFPSLKFDTHRRFCYVQFLTSGQAKAATQLDGKALSGNLVLHAKISDPKAKKDRVGAMQEGRELFIGNLHWNATEDGIKAIFQKFGTVEQVRIPRNIVGKSKGAAFVIFSSRDEAMAALEMNLTEVNGRVINVNIAKSNVKGAKRQATTIFHSASPEPGSVEMKHDSFVTTANSPASTAIPPKPSVNDHHSRTLALLDIPDTVNDARIRALMEPYGSLKKLVLRPDRGGATVEFENATDMKRAGFAVDGFEITPGNFIRVGDWGDLMRRKYAGGGGGEGGEARPNHAVGHGEGKKQGRQNGIGGEKKEAKLLHVPSVHRPGQGGSKRGGRGGLGFVGGLRGRPETNGIAKSTNGGNVSEDGGGKGKSPADFRAMLEKK